MSTPSGTSPPDALQAESAQRDFPSPEPSRHKQYTEDEDFWYPDGSVVLIARHEVAFCVHKGVLADHSPVFRDLFVVPQPLEDQECCEGCPVVHLTDAPDELKSLLRVLYHPRRCYMPTDRISFAFLAALIRLGHKYALDDLVSSALARLKACFPASFDPRADGAYVGGSEPVDRVPEDAVTAVNLARLVGEDADGVLPSALYACCQLRARALARGVPRAHGETERLNDADLERCVDARARLAVLVVSSVVQRLKPGPAVAGAQGAQKEGCTQVFCAPFLASAAARVLAGQSGPPNPYGALDSVEWFVTDAVRGGLLCRVCAAAVRERDEQERRRIFDLLPEVFGLHLEG